jgi:hypothetical protein
MNELTRLYLLEAHCLPILTYATVSVDLRNDQIHDLNVAWNSVFRRIFHYNRWESVKPIMAGLGKLDFRHIRLKFEVNFLRNNYLHSKNGAIKYITIRNIFANFHNLCSSFKLPFNYHMMLSKNIAYCQIMHFIYKSFEGVCN